MKVANEHLATCDPDTVNIEKVDANDERVIEMNLSLVAHVDNEQQQEEQMADCPEDEKRIDGDLKLRHKHDTERRSLIKEVDDISSTNK